MSLLDKIRNPFGQRRVPVQYIEVPLKRFPGTDFTAEDITEDSPRRRELEIDEQTTGSTRRFYHWDNEPSFADIPAVQAEGEVVRQQIEKMRQNKERQ